MSRRTGLTESGNLARKVNNNRSIAQHVLDTTVEIDGAPKCQHLHRSAKATTAYRLGDVVVQPGQEYFRVRSDKFAPLCYIVAWNEARQSWQCSCGAGCKQHAHITVVNKWIAENVRKSA